MIRQVLFSVEDVRKEPFGEPSPRARPKLSLQLQCHVHARLSDVWPSTLFIFACVFEYMAAKAQ